MRSLMLVALALALLGAPATASDVSTPAVATNTVCPTCDKAVDPAKDPTVTVKGKDDKDVTLAACCKGCAGKIEADPATFADKASKGAEKDAKKAVKDVAK